MAEVILFDKPTNVGGSLTEIFDVEDDAQQTGVAEVNRFFVFDVTVDESHDTTVTWTSQPIEDGAKITDHGVLEQFRLSMTGFVSASPVFAAQRQEDRLADALLQLQEIAESKRLIEVSTSLLVYSKMVIESLSVPRSHEDGQAFNVSLSLVQLKIVSSASVRVPASILKPALRPGGASKGKGGRQPGKDDDGSAPETAAGKAASQRKTSLAKQGFKAMNRF